MASTRCFSISGSSRSALAGRVIGAMMSGFAALSRETSVDRSAGGSGHGMTSTMSQAGLAALWAAWNDRAWTWPNRSLAYRRTIRFGEIAGLLEDLPHELHRPLAEHRPGREVAVDVLDLLLPFLHRLGDVRRDGVGRRDVDDEGDSALLGDRDHRIRVPRAERAHEELRAAVDEPLGFLPCHLGLRLRVAEQELELGPAQRLDAARLVDGLRGQLGAEPAGLPGLGERAGHRVEHAELDRRRLGSQDRREPEGGQASPRPPPRSSAGRSHAPRSSCSSRPAIGGPAARAR